MDLLSMTIPNPAVLWICYNLMVTIEILLIAWGQDMYRLKQIDYFLILPYLFLSAIGVVMVYSSSANVAVQNGSTPIAYLVKQLLFVFLGFILTGFMTAVNLKKIRTQNILMAFYGVFIVLCLYLLVKGKTVNGAAGWINFGPINLQPAEFLKFYLIIFTAQFLSAPKMRNDLLGGHWWQVMRIPLGMSALLIIMVLLQPDMGNATILSGIIFMMCLGSGISFKRSYAILGATAAIIVGVVFPISLKLYESGAIKSYKLARLVAFVDPFGHQRGTGQQLVNSYYALSNGGLFGVGLGNSIQKRGYLPEPNTDFIMAITGEELGLVAIIVILILLGMIVWRAVKIGIKSQNMFNALVCYGIATYFAIQAAINVGGVIGWLPITGVTFPFISYGGSSILSLTLCLGTLLNISAQERGRRSTNDGNSKTN